MPETVKMIVVLTLISALASLGLSAFNEHTMPFIQENERQYTLRSIKKAIPGTDKPDPCAETVPGFDNRPDQDAVCVDGTTVYRGRSGGEAASAALGLRVDDCNGDVRAGGRDGAVSPGLHGILRRGGAGAGI